MNSENFRIIKGRLLECDLGVGLIPFDLEDVQRCGLQPLISPIIDAACLYGKLSSNILQEVIYGRIPPFKPAEVILHPSKKLIFCDQKKELLESRSSFLIGDSVKDGKGLGCIGNSASDGMVGILPFIIFVAPNLAIPEVEVRLESELILEGLQAVAGHPLSKALIEPEIVPPLHGHVVAEPMMRQLVGDHQRDDVEVILGRILIRQHVLLTEGDYTRILHGIRSELPYEDLIIFVEGIPQSEFFLE